jgi:hypothetical protein
MAVETVGRLKPVSRASLQLETIARPSVPAALASAASTFDCDFVTSEKTRWGVIAMVLPLLRWAGEPGQNGEVASCGNRFFAAPSGVV